KSRGDRTNQRFRFVRIPDDCFEQRRRLPYSLCFDERFGKEGLNLTVARRTQVGVLEMPDCRFEISGRRLNLAEVQKHAWVFRPKPQSALQDRTALRHLTLPQKAERQVDLRFEKPGVQCDRLAKARLRPNEVTFADRANTQ